MLLGFAQPQASDWAYHDVPKSAQMLCWALNRIQWVAGDDSGPLETGLASTGWRVNTSGGYAKVSLLIPVLVGVGTNGSGIVTSPYDPTGAAHPTTMTLADVAAGVWDALYTTMFTNIATYLPDAILRVGNEWYGASWYPWNGPSQGAAGRLAYRHLVDLARSIHPGFQYEWLGCLDLSDSGGYTFQNVQDFYPGDDYVDYLSGDLYDTTTGTVGQAMWDVRARQASQCLAFAQAHHKPYCVTEWGLYNIAQVGIGNDDDWAYIQAGYRWMRANAASLGWMTYFNPASWDGRLQNNPQSEALYKALFGAWARELNGVTTPRFISPGYGTIGAVSVVGHLARAKDTALRTLAVTPTAVGNALVLSILNFATTVTVSAVSGGGVTTWHKIVNANPGTAEGDSELWYGVITTPGPATITITSAATGATILGCQEFTIGTPATWAVDTSAASTSTAATVSGIYPSITPAARNELYVGTALLLGGGLGGATAGFTYLGGFTGYEPNAQFVYKLVASTPTAQAPAWTQTSGVYSAVSALLTATPVTAGADSHRLRV